MNENLQPKAPSNNDWLASARKTLEAAGIPTAALDSDVILAHTMKRPRTSLHAHPDDLLDPRIREIADARLRLRVDRVPLAYIIGHKEFYGRRFAVTTATLIPRPESETIIEQLKKFVPEGSTARLVDVGAGSGNLGITAKLERPNLDVTLVDISQHALVVAKRNATLLHAEVEIYKSDLLALYPYVPEIIVANLPYVDESWPRSPETNHEPETALFATHGGLALIHRLIDEAGPRQPENGLLFIEADPSQHELLIRYAAEHGYSLIEREDYCVVFRKLGLTGANTVEENQ